MKGTRKIITESELPIPVPTTDTGWKDMRRRLDDEMPDTIAPAFKSTVFQNKRLILLMLLLIPAGAWMIYSLKQSNTNHTENIKQANASKQSAELLPAQHTPDNTIGLHSSDKENLNQNNPVISEKSIVKLKSENISQPNHRPIISDDRIAAIKKQQAKTKGNKQSSKKKNAHKNVDNDNTEAFSNTDIALATITVDPNNSDNPENRDNLNNNIPGNPGNSGYLGNASNSDNPENPENAGWRFEGGLYWPLQIPMAAASAYFTGTTGNSQPYRVLIPGGWIQAESNKHLLTLEVNPFSTSLVSSKAFRSETIMTSVPDTLVTTIQTKSLLKLFGTNAGIGYAYNISGNMWLGGSVQAYWWRDAVASATGEIQKKPLNGSPGTVTAFNSNYPLSNEWNYFSKFQLYLNAEALYRGSSWQGGLRLGIAATPLSMSKGPSYPLRLELFYRLRLFTLKSKAQTNWVQ